MPVTTTTMLAHQGGWDEILLVAGPIVVIASLLRLAKRRVDRAAQAAESTPDRSATTEGGPLDRGTDPA
jgi:hypothetical protein